LRVGNWGHRRGQVGTKVTEMGEIGDRDGGEMGTEMGGKWGQRWGGNGDRGRGKMGTEMGENGD
jgi:hypothetical protein